MDYANRTKMEAGDWPTLNTNAMYNYLLSHSLSLEVHSGMEHYTWYKNWTAFFDFLKKKHSLEKDLQSPFLFSLKSNGLTWPENYHIRLESGEFLILGHEEVPLGYSSKSTIICNHFQKFQKFKDSSLFWWPFSLALKLLSCDSETDAFPFTNIINIIS